MRANAYEALRAALVVVAGCNADGAYDREETLIRIALAEPKVSPIPGDPFRQRLLSGRLFAEQLQRVFGDLRHESIQGGLRTPLYGPTTLLLVKALELDGYAFEGYMVAWSWWSAVCADGVVLDGSDVLKELERDAA